MQKRDCKIMRCLGIERKEQRPDESLIAVLHLPMQNCPKTESRIWSTPTAPMTSPTARNAFTLEFACRCSQAGSIEQTDWHTIQIDRFFDGVARRAMCFADDHSIVAEKPIEQARFAGIRRSVDHHPHTFAQNAPLIGGGEQRIDLLANRIEPPAQRFTFIRY